MALWAKVDVEMPTDGKLLGQPVVTRHLWTCLICLAKRQDEHGAIRGYTCALLAGCFNLPAKSVAAGLTYFQTVRMVELEVDGTIRLVNFDKRQGERTVAEKREGDRDRQERKRAASRVTDDAVSRVTNGIVTSDIPTPVTLLEQNRTEGEKKEEDQRVADAPAQPSIEELQSDWPAELLERVKLAVTSTRKSGQMAEGPWRAFLLSAKQYSPGLRVRASETYLDGAMAGEGKGERYLLGIMRGEHTRLQQPLRANGARGAVLSISEDAKKEHDIPGRKMVSGQ